MWGVEEGRRRDAVWLLLGTTLMFFFSLSFHPNLSSLAFGLLASFLLSGLSTHSPRHDQSCLPSFSPRTRTAPGSCRVISAPLAQLSRTLWRPAWVCVSQTSCTSVMALRRRTVPSWHRWRSRAWSRDSRNMKTGTLVWTCLNFFLGGNVVFCLLFSEAENSLSNVVVFTDPPQQVFELQYKQSYLRLFLVHGLQWHCLRS